MDHPYDLQSSHKLNVPWDWTRVFLVLVASLTATVGFEAGSLQILRVAGIQYLEIVYFFQIVLLVVYFCRHNYQTRLLRSAFTLGILYAIFLTVAFLLGLVSLRNDFYIPSGIGLLKHPVWITLSRMTQLFVDVTIMLYLIDLFRRKRDNLIFTFRLYFWVGVASAVFSILTYPLNIYFNSQIGTYSDFHRMRGFYNEGGPYGLYLLSVFLVGFVLSREKWARPARIRLTYIPLVIAFVDSQSKAALLAVALILLFNALMVKQVVRRIAVVAVLLLTFFVVSQVPSVRQAFNDYIKVPESYEYLSTLDAHQDLLSGRIAGAFIVRRMIAVHPLLGIGWGNYALVRNSPEYRGGAGWADFYDEPGLGILGATADFGIPLTLFLICVTFYPYFYLRRRGVPLAIKNLALVQPVVHLCGAQLNLTYPWLITAFALGLGYYYSSRQLGAYTLQYSPAGSPAQPLPVASAPETAT